MSEQKTEPLKPQIKPFEANHHGYKTTIVLEGTTLFPENKVEIIIRGAGGTLDHIVELIKANQKEFQPCHVIVTTEEFCWGG